VKNLHSQENQIRTLFKKLKKGLEEAIAHEKGKLTLKSEIIEIPESAKAETNSKSTK
jgi:hypothetical protein